MHDFYTEVKTVNSVFAKQNLIFRVIFSLFVIAYL